MDNQKIIFRFPVRQEIFHGQLKNIIKYEETSKENLAKK
jgi:hypothetical protein